MGCDSLSLIGWLTAGRPQRTKIHSATVSRCLEQMGAGFGLGHGLGRGLGLGSGSRSGVLLILLGILLWRDLVVGCFVVFVIYFLSKLSPAEPQARWQKLSPNGCHVTGPMNKRPWECTWVRGKVRDVASRSIARYRPKSLGAGIVHGSMAMCSSCIC